MAPDLQFVEVTLPAMPTTTLCVEDRIALGAVLFLPVPCSGPFLTMLSVALP